MGRRLGNGYEGSDKTRRDEEMIAHEKRVKRVKLHENMRKGRGESD